jgi:hypothetical protein
VNDIADGIFVGLDQAGAITGTLLPPADASTTIARRNRTLEPVPRRTSRCSF